MTESTEKSSLILLQNRMKKDPESYKDSFDETYKKFNELWKTFLLNPSSHEEELISLVMFLAQVCQCYKEYANEFASQIKSVLSKHGPQLDADMRLTFCKVLILLRNKDLVSPVEILKLFFELFRCSDKVLRETLKNYIIHDIKNINMKSRNVSLNSELQNFMFLMLKDGNIAASKISLDIVIELYNRKIWNNARTANIISTALFSKAPKMVMAALKFFTGNDEEEGEADDSDDDDDVKPTETRNAKQLQLAYRVGKKNNKREKRMKRALEMIQNQKKKKKKVNTCFSAIHLLNDPQDLADRVFGQLDRPKLNEMLNVRMMKLKFVSQLVGTHKLILLQYYPFMDRYLKPSQRDVTKILLYLAQACHEIVPPDVITSSIRTIVNNFVSEHNSNEVMAVGLNAVREICNRCPLAMDVDLLHDLALYKKYKDKCVSMAAQSLIGLFRSKNPELLHRSFLGKPTVAMAEKEKALEYGVSGAKDYLPGAEILPDEEELKEQQEEEEWESCSEDDDSDGSWVDVSHSSDEGENNAEENAVKEMTQEERIEKSRKVFETRILTEEDFKKIESYQKKKESEFFKKGNNKREHSEAFPEEGGELLALSNIENVHKKRKHDKESRLATVMAGREGRTKFGDRKGRSNEFASTSNKEKLKNKNFMMVRQKVKKKAPKKASFQDKKETLKKYLLSKLKQKSK